MGEPNSWETALTRMGCLHSLNQPLFVSGMSHLCPCLLPCSILPFIPFSAVTFRSISYRLGSSLHVEARLQCVTPLYFDLALRSTFAERINSQTCDSRTGCLDLLSVSLYIVAVLFVHSAPNSVHSYTQSADFPNV